MVDKYAVSSVSEVEGHILVGLFAAGTPVLVPEIHDLAIFHKRSKPLTQAVHALTHGQVKLFVDIVAIKGLHVAHATPAAACNDPISIAELNAPITLLHPHAELVAGEGGSLFVLLNDYFVVLIRLEIELRFRRSPTLMVVDSDTDDVGHGRRELHRQEGQIGCVVPTGYLSGSCINRKHAVLDLRLMYLRREVWHDVGTHSPVSVRELHFVFSMKDIIHGRMPNKAAAACVVITAPCSPLGS